MSPRKFLMSDLFRYALSLILVTTNHIVDVALSLLPCDSLDLPNAASVDGRTAWNICIDKPVSVTLYVANIVSPRLVSCSPSFLTATFNSTLQQLPVYKFHTASVHAPIRFIRLWIPRLSVCALPGLQQALPIVSPGQAPEAQYTWTLANRLEQSDGSVPTVGDISAA